MSAFLEVWGSAGASLVALEGIKAAVGKAQGNDVVITGDSSVSRVHLALDAIGAGWTVTDVGSRNGTWINGERLLGPQVLRPGDEIRIGRTRIVFRARGVSSEASMTTPAVGAPLLTEREQEFLAALCQPVLETNILTEPASIADMGAALNVSESAVKKGLGRLYDKFGLHDAERRRGRLVSEAITRGAIRRGARS